MIVLERWYTGANEQETNSVGRFMRRRLSEAVPFLCFLIFIPEFRLSCLLRWPELRWIGLSLAQFRCLAEIGTRILWVRC